MNSKMLRILCLDDIIEDADLIKEVLKNDGLSFEFDFVSDEVKYTERLSSGKYDIILSDYNLPGFTGIGALLLAKKLCPQIPFICVSGTIGEDLAVELMHLGASDYIIKNKLSKLPVAVSRALKEADEHKTRLLAEKSLIASEARFRDIIMCSNDWVWEIDNEWKYCYSSEKVKNILGYSPEEMIGKRPFDFMPPEAQKTISSLFNECVREKGIIKDLENLNIHKDGHEVYLLTNGFPVLDPAGNLIGYRGVDKDITEWKKLEIDLREAKLRAEASDKLKTAFLSNISHEVRTPLNGILGFAEFIMQPDLLQEEKDNYLQILNESSYRLLNTITNYMDISLIVSGNMKVKSKHFDVTKTLEKVYSLFLPKCRAKGLDLIADFPEKFSPLIFGDEVLMEKSVIHILDNALKFTSVGTITLGLRIISTTLEIFIRDTGTGIDSDSQNSIYKVFVQGEVSETRGYEGSGLGLSITKGLIELMGGNISLKSEPGKGSLFTLKFDIGYINGNTAFIQNDIKKKRSDSLSPLILIAEDDESTISLMKVVFSKHSIKYLVAKTGNEAIELCHSNPEISMVLMDIKMPVMDGLEATRRIKEFRKKLPIIGLTAYAMRGDKEKALNAGCDDYLAKPVTSFQLLEIVNKNLE